MAKPPVFDRSQPIGDGPIEDYFRALIEMTKDAAHDKGIKFTFKNYTETINEFRKVQMGQKQASYQLAQDIVLWIHYLSDMLSVVEKAYYDAETDKIAIFNSISMGHDTAKVGRGDRFANQDERVINIRKKRNKLKALVQNIDRKIRALDKMYYFCKSTWENNELNDRFINSQSHSNAREFSGF